MLLSFLLVTLASGSFLRADEAEDFYYALLGIIPSDGLDNAGLTTFPVLNLPLGGEMQGFAGAYTAVARDASYLEANPAGSALLDHTEFSVQTASIIDGINLESLVFTDRQGDLGYGAYVKLLHGNFTAVSATGSQNASATYMESVACANISYAFLRNFYFSGISVGASVKLAGRIVPAELYRQVTSVAGQDQSSLGIMGDVGLLTRFNLFKAYSSRDKNFSVGLAFMNAGPPVDGDPLPTHGRAGISYQPIRPLLLTGEVKIPVNLADPSRSETIGFGIGSALQFIDLFNIRAGFYLDAGSPRIALGTHIDLDTIAFDINYNLDFSSTIAVPDHLGLQASFNFGDNGRSSLARKVDNLYIDALVALSKSDWDEVIRLCEAVLEIDDGYTPAADTLRMARRSKELEKQLEDIQNQGA